MYFFVTDPAVAAKSNYVDGGLNESSQQQTQIDAGMHC